MFSLSSVSRSTRTLVRGFSSKANVTVIGSHDAYETFVQKQPKALVYFTASWCGPCRRIAPVYEELSANNPDIAFAKVDVDDLEDTAAEQGIRSMPTFQAHVNGEFQPDLQFSGADSALLEQTVEKLKSL